MQVERVINKTEIIQKYPQIGKKVDEVKDNTVREVMEGNYRIIYRIVSSKEVHIMMIHHGARDLARRINL